MARVGGGSVGAGRPFSSGGRALQEVRLGWAGAPGGPAQVGGRPGPGGPANAWAIDIHSSARSPSTTSPVSATFRRWVTTRQKSSAVPVTLAADPESAVT